MGRAGERAVVLGAGMGGLLAAGALAGAFDRVTVIERDALPAGVAPRRAIPQGQHVHALLPAGQASLEQLLPGLTDELLAAGAIGHRPLQELRFMIGGHWLARADGGRDVLLASRPLLEGHVRRRVRALENVTIIDRCDALGLTGTAGGDRVTGVQVLRREPGSAAETLPADLVVAASGRGARVGAWLEALGHRRPAEERLPVDFAYASVALELPEGALGADKFVLIGARPGLARTLALAAQEGGRWLLTVGGYAGDHPPSDRERLLAFAATVAPPDVAHAIARATPLGDIAAYRFAANQRRFYERMANRPRALLPIGDALCAFNPIYGQGMTVAAREALALRDALRAGHDGLERRYLQAAATIVDDAWRLAAGADLAQPAVSGRRPLPVRLTNGYLGRLQAAAAHDETLAIAFIRVCGMLDRPQALLRPALAARVLRGARGRARSEHGTGVRRRELQLGAASTVVREAGPPNAREAVVFLHGNPGPAAEWEPLLATVGARWRAVAFDQPGFGDAVAPTGFPQTVEAHAAFIGHTLDTLGIERVHLVAHDLGGPWGLRWAADDPGRLASATLLNTGVLPGYRWHALARLWRTPRAGELFMATTTRAGFGLLLRRGQPQPLPRAAVDRMYAGFGARTRRAVLELYRSMSDVGAEGERLAQALRPLDRPALVLWGRHDPYVGVELADRQRRAFPHADVRVLDRSGHWPHLDASDTVAAALIDFLARHATPHERHRPEPHPLPL